MPARTDPVVCWAPSMMSANASRALVSSPVVGLASPVWISPSSVRRSCSVSGRIIVGGPAGTSRWISSKPVVEL